MTNDQLLDRLPAPLLTWYQQEKRDLPWRDPIIPYHTWLSEIMLQQTRVDAVIEYYYRFLSALPTIADLADAPEEQLLKLWEGLGYYNRVRNLQKAAKIVVSEYGGELPADHKKLQKLPGIGSYTAGAIGAIAFGLPTPAVDGNVLRVATRITGSTDNISKTKTKAKYEALLADIMKKPPVSDCCGDFVQALMELGALICVPNGAPKCELCPAKDFCTAYREDCWDELPVKDEKKPRRIEEKTVLIVRVNDQIALHRRPAKGLLAGLWELPSLPAYQTPDEVRTFCEQQGYSVETVEPLGDAKHIFSHIEWKMKGMLVTLSALPEKSSWRFVPIAEIISDYALPSAFDAFRPWICGNL